MTPLTLQDLTPESILNTLADIETEFTYVITQHRYWEILPAPDQPPVAVYDTEKHVRYGVQPSKLESLYKENPFLILKSWQGTVLGTLETATGLLWSNQVVTLELSRDKALEALESATHAGCRNWRLPTYEEFEAFNTREGNPNRTENRLLRTADGSESYFWLSDPWRVDVNGEWREIDLSESGYIFAVHEVCKEALERSGFSGLALLLIEKQWQLATPDGKASFLTPQQQESGVAWRSLTLLQLMHLLAERGESLRVDGRVFSFAPHPAFALLSEIDYRPSRLPKLEKKDLTDPERGLWELHGAPPDKLRRWQLVARNPARDLKSYPVAIDFGTASTVVAVQTDTQNALLRIGARDYYAPIEPQHFENPTVVECLDFPTFRETWTRTAYRPAHDWDWMRVGHEALAAWRDNPGETKVLTSILPKLKQWALRGPSAPRLRLTDRLHGTEVEIPPLTDRRPVRGEPLQVSPDDPFDPIEFYAWQLGMAINWRGRGLFLEYLLTFPIKYERAQKEKILASFARGLQRSLPQTLIDQGKALVDFQVKEIASEPAAYAAAALPHLGLAATEAGLAYAVFDFGGGTADFDYGLWRLATPEEVDKGYEEVFEHIASAGDAFLGGENLLEHLAYQVFCANLDQLRAKRIHFTRPLDAQPFPGDESLVQPTQAAQTNTVLVASRLRNFWEGKDAGFNEPQLKIQLLDANNQKQEVALRLDADALDAYLRTRIRTGVLVFLHELARAFRTLEVPEVHILLAGNASHSRHVRALFTTDSEDWKALITETWPDKVPFSLVVHAPLPMDKEHVYAPTAKTGVALGLLRLAPGNGVLLIDHVRAQHDEAPFRYFVGRLRRGVFQPVLTPESPYGQWHELGAVADGVFNLRYTQSLRARGEMREGDGELNLYRYHLPEAEPGQRLWARPVAPGVIELALGMGGDAPSDQAPHIRLDLEALKSR
ncbi:hypothetical protein [Tepidiphilus baoligensis]|uniref:DUF1566 domain-containing protein n=1 Tax=Tepidiphilus baoligensis TaxID=2698687 RepID=A0ABX1QLW1_9PROT|nr:hypothetical protein [Tepidiphilus baoligensis]NMH16276.1 hypothetical protein [Tepidiphilus baoligensis]